MLTHPTCAFSAILPVPVTATDLLLPSVFHTAAMPLSPYRMAKWLWLFLAAIALRTAWAPPVFRDLALWATMLMTCLLASLVIHSVAADALDPPNATALSARSFFKSP